MCATVLFMIEKEMEDLSLILFLIVFFSLRVQSKAWAAGESCESYRREPRAPSWRSEESSVSCSDQSGRLGVEGSLGPHV